MERLERAVNVCERLRKRKGRGFNPAPLVSSGDRRRALPRALNAGARQGIVRRTYSAVGSQDARRKNCMRCVMGMRTQ